jgi:TP901 family phage tail tape measure protein
MALETIFKLGVILSMLDRLSGPSRIASTNVANLQRRMESLQAASESWMTTGAGMVAAGGGIAAAVLMPTVATHATRKALGELASVGVKDLQAVETAATNFSNKWSGTTKSQFITAAYDIKSGISSLADTGVAEYTRLAGLTGKATKATTEEMTSLFATGYGIYKDFYGNLSDIKFGQMFSGGIAASVQQFKTTGSGMAEAISGLGAAATSAKRPMEEQLTVLGMLQSTMSGGEAGTKYGAFIQSAAAAGDELGLKFVNNQNQLLGITDIIGKLRVKYGNTLDAIEKQQLTKAFGTEEAVDLIDLLYPKLDALQGNIGNIRQAMKGGTQVTNEMARAMNMDPGARWQIVAQQFQNMKEVIGSQLLPVVEPAVEKLGRFITRVTELAGKNTEATRTIGLMLMGFSAFLITIGVGIATLGFFMNGITRIIQLYQGVMKVQRILSDSLLTLRIRGLYAMDSLRSGWTKLSQGAGTAYNATRRVGTAVADMSRRAAIAAATGVKNLVASTANLARTAGTAAVAALRSMTASLAGMAAQAIRTAVMALPGLIAGVWSFTAALLANPVTWAVLGIVALIAVVVLLWRNWDKVTVIFQAGWAKIQGAFGSGAAFVRNIFSQMTGFLQVKAGEFRQSGAALIEAFVGGIKSVINKPYETVKEGLVKLRQLLPFSDAREGPLSRLTRSGQAVLETFAGGIKKRLGLPGKALAGALSGMSLGMPLTAQPAFAGLPRGIAASLPGAGDFTAAEMPTPTVAGRERRLERFNLREVLRESRFAREKETIRDTKSRPVVVVVNGGQGEGGNVEDYVDLAYRYLSMQGD